MRVWDVDPGYLNRQSLLGEHREIHAILSIVTNQKKGYARHPETLRWKDRLGALKHRHDRVVSEMRLRGYQHHSPASVRGSLVWPDVFVDSPGQQFVILQGKYVDRDPGRIPLPRTAEELWEQHTHSVLARDPDYHRRTGQLLARSPNGVSFNGLALELVKVLRCRPSEEHLQETMELMWERVVDLADSAPIGVGDHPESLIATIRQLSVDHQVIPLLHSTALSDLHMWLLGFGVWGG